MRVMPKLLCDGGTGVTSGGRDLNPSKNRK